MLSLHGYASSVLETRFGVRRPPGRQPRRCHRQSAQQRLRQIDPAKLASSQQDSLQTVQSFLDKAREALQAQDVQRAFTLADKAYLLADELAKRPR
jgi:hypothetical protein